MYAYFAGGCFWCITPIFKSRKGVKTVICGYSGGEEVNPTYYEVKNQLTSHRETIKIEYDENIISFNKLLDIFLANVDVYNPNGQYIDKGHSYTLAIYYTNDIEKEKALKRLSEYKERIYVAVEEYKNFYEAEEYHQDYYLKNPIEFEKEMKESGRKK